MITRLETRWNILIIHNTDFTIIIDPIRILCFFTSADFTKHTDHILTKSLLKNILNIGYTDDR